MARASHTIKRLLRELIEIFAEDEKAAFREVGSLFQNGPDEYRSKGETKNPAGRVEKLIQYVLQRDESDCQRFLTHLENMLPSFPALSDIVAGEKKRNTLIKMLESYKESKLSLRDILDIGQENINEVAPQTVQDLPWALLRKLMALDRTARTIQLDNISQNSGADNDSLEENIFKQMDFKRKYHESNSINPLDILCVLLHCSDMLLQQNIFSKMSMCQFAVPLLLPAGDGPEYTFMLWAMRDIVKRWRPHTLAENKGFIEENLVKSEMPCFSFVRLGQIQLSKSKILNQLLSPAQQYQDFFIHENMIGGDTEREISNGLVEISWFLPVGRENSDTFPEPVAVTNLRGDIESNWTQFSFLTQVSSAVFVFAESINERECELLAQCSKSYSNFYFIITPSGKSVSKETVKFLKELQPLLHFNQSHILIKDKQANEAGLVKKLQNIIQIFLRKTDKKVKLEDLANTATELGIKVDENSQECQKAKEYTTEIIKEIQDMVKYKKETMKLQGNLWKQVAQVEKELCRMRKQGDKKTEQYRSQLTQTLKQLHWEQNQHVLPDTMSKFIFAITHLSQSEKHYFLTWMKFALDSMARNNLSVLKEKYKEKYSKTNNQEELKQLDQQICDSSLGVEHFLREMGQFYEAECSMVKQGILKPDMIQFSHLPGIAADLLLDGFPLELMDGDASNIPLKWVTDLLTELNNKTGGKCRMRVITVLGVQSTGKSTLLNTMFGLQFSVSSGRCTRGAFLTLIKVKENFQKKINCEFILVIDTEGLKAPELASLEDSYEHDNELATLVVGLSDITIINMAMENTAEMRDTLQIVVHAFLRMNEIGKKPNCQFVHQNVSDVSAHDNNMRDREKLLEQLDEMTRIAANMEKKSGITRFSDIMDYNIERDSWYIPGLWYGDPPMASVNSGYSGNVFKVKKYLFKFMEKRESLQQPQNLVQFIEWIKSLWKSVKHENFIFSFRNSLVAEAYNQLAMEYSQWEWNFRKHIHTWLISTENKIKNQSVDKLQPEIRCEDLKDNLISLLFKEEKIMLLLLKQYFERKTDNVNLIEKYKEDFSRGVKSLRKELEISVTAKIDETIRIQNGKNQIENIENSYQKTMEEKVTHLLEQVREKKCQLKSGEIEKVFENMWKSTIAELPKNVLQKRQVNQDMLLDLKKDLANKGSSINEKFLSVKHLDYFKFQINKQHLDLKWYSSKGFKEFWTNECHDKTVSLAFSLIGRCSDYVKEKFNTGGDYDGTYCQELLNIINERLRKEDVKNLHITHQFELDLKLHIFGNAASMFQKLHERFIQENDPVICLEKLKSHYWETFHNIYEKKDETQSRAKQFCELCLKPAISNQIYEHLGKDIVDDILFNQNSKELSSRSFFQSHVLEKLLENKNFSQFVTYINSYELFVKQWLKQYIFKTYEKGLEKLSTKILSDICKKITNVLQSLQNSPTVSDFLKAFCDILKSDLVISQSKLKLISFQNKADIRQFSKDIGFFLTETEKQIKSEITSSSTESVLMKLTLKPEDELFKRVFGCGKQCPFCKVPCEAGAADHKEHFASVHRPQGLGRYRCEDNKKLMIEVCSTYVISDWRFKNSDTEQKWHPYKEYRTFYPDWAIQPDPSITASDYWKYIFGKFNNEFADEYDALPADLPDQWNTIKETDAFNSLKEIYKS